MTAIGRLHHVIYDTPDPMGLARFWSAVLGQPITYTSDDFVVVAPHEDHSGMAFQLAPDHQAPVWGDPTRPQQVHQDVMVDDVPTAERQVAALGARRLASPGRLRVGRPGWTPVLPHPSPGLGASRHRGLIGRAGATNRFGVIVASTPA